MTRKKIIVLVALFPALLCLPEPMFAAQNLSWDGTWKGYFGGNRVISITIEKNKLINYEFMGEAVAFTYNKITDTTVSFGDKDHYSMTLTAKGNNTASATYHGRLGYSKVTLSKI